MLLDFWMFIFKGFNNEYHHQEEQAVMTHLSKPFNEHSAYLSKTKLAISSKNSAMAFPNKIVI
jgi:hypothetical protein